MAAAPLLPAGLPGYGGACWASGAARSGRGRRVDVPCAVISPSLAPSHAFLLGEQNGAAAVLRARGSTPPAVGARATR